MNLRGGLGNKQEKVVWQVPFQSQKMLSAHLVPGTVAGVGNKSPCSENLESRVGGGRR